MPIDIRMSTVEDISALARLRHGWHEENNGPTPDPGFAERFAAWYRQQGDRVHWLAESDGEAVGMVNLLVYRRMPSPGRNSHDWGYLGNAYVAAEHRDRGVGGRLLAALLNHAEELSLQRIMLNPTKRSVPYYERAGFAFDGRLMVKVLR